MAEQANIDNLIFEQDGVIYVEQSLLNTALAVRDLNTELRYGGSVGLEDVVMTRLEEVHHVPRQQLKALYSRIVAGVSGTNSEIKESGGL